MTAIIIDRRRNGRTKNTPNRRRFMQRVKTATAKGIRAVVSDATIKDLVSDAERTITIPASGISEPSFSYQPSSGNVDMVIPGNDQFIVGDKIKRPQSDDGEGGEEGGDSGSGGGEGDFSFSLSREDFMDLLFDQCELPDLVKESISETPQQERVRVGFSSEGPPSALNVVRSMRGAHARRKGLTAAKAKKLKLLEEELAVLQQSPTKYEEAEQYLLEEIEKLQARMKKVPFVDPIDLKYTAWDVKDVPNLQAVVICVMDVSGSMGAHHRMLSKIFFLLLYLFLTKSYDKVDIRFVTYHETGKEVDEHEFWNSRDAGGTMASSGLEVVRDILQSDYPPETWNAYVAHASDGDNYNYDNDVCVSILEGDILPRVQYYAYIQVSSEYDKYYSLSAYSTDLLSVFNQLKSTYPHVAAEHVTTEGDVYPVFLKLFKRRGAIA